MEPGGETVSTLTINSSPIEFGTATLHRSEATLPSGLPGSADWQLEVMNGRLPDDAGDDVRVELTAGGVSYTGAGRLVDDDGSGRGARVIVANGPLISYARIH